jgi:hypothetical protein
VHHHLGVRPNSGTVNVESYAGAEQGAHLALSVDPSFAAIHLSGHLDTAYCPLAEQQGTGCFPQLRRSGSDAVEEWRLESSPQLAVCWKS